MDDFVGAKFYCPHTFADGKQRIWIMEKTLEFSSAVLYTLFAYHVTKYLGKRDTCRMNKRLLK